MRSLRRNTCVLLITGVLALLCFILHAHTISLQDGGNKDPMHQTKIRAERRNVITGEEVIRMESKTIKSGAGKPPRICNVHNTCNSLSADDDDFNNLNDSRSRKPLLVVLYPANVFRQDLNIDNNPNINKHCVFTLNQTKIPEADFVFFHLNFLPRGFPSRSPWQRWVIYTNEPPYKTGKSDTLTLSKFDGMFNFTAQYSFLSDVPTPYFYCRVAKSEDTKLNKWPKMPQKSGLVSWAVSDCTAESERRAYVEKLAEHVPIDIFGLCSSVKRRNNSFDGMMKKYKFYLAFENSFCRDYITEKLFKVLTSYESYVIPVVLGRGPYEGAAPEGSYVNVRDYNSPENLANHLHYLDRNESAFMEYFKWRDNYTCVPKSEPYKTERRCQALLAVAHKAQILNTTSLLKVFGKKENCITAHKYYENLGVSV